MDGNLFTYDLVNQTITDNTYRDLAGISSITTYKLGEIFVNFINFNFSFYDDERKKAVTIFEKLGFEYPSSSFNYSNIDDLIDSKFPNLAGKYYELSHGDSLGAIIEYLLDIPARIPYSESSMFNNFQQFTSKNFFDFMHLQNIVKENWVPCLDIDCNASLTPLQKYIYLEDFSFSMDGFSFHEKTIIRHRYTWREQVDFEIKTYANKEKFVPDADFTIESTAVKKETVIPTKSTADEDVVSLKKNTTSALDKIAENPEWKDREIEIIHGYTFESPKEALQCEFLKMLELGIKIRKCAVCGKYFIVTGHNGKCCDNLYKDTGLTCQQVFSDRNYKNKRKQNPILKEYDKAYKRMYARYSNKKNLSSKEYSSWREKATQERDKALEAYNRAPSETIVNEFKQFLGNK